MVAAVALMALTACTKENVNEGGAQAPEMPAPSYYVEFTAEAANDDAAATPSAPSSAQSKTTFDETAKKTLWEMNDAISVNGMKFQTTELADDGLSARFVNTEELGSAFAKPYVAVSPYQAGHVVDGTTVSGISLKASQTATSASFESNAVVAMAYNADNNVLSFKNVCSIVKFKLGTADVKEVTITSNNGESLAGTIKVDYNNGEPKVLEVADGTAEVKLSGNFTTTDTYYVAVLASGLENGITISLDGAVAKTVANVLEFKRSIVMNAGTLSVTSTTQSVWTVVGGHNGWNTSTGTAMKKERGLLVAKNVSVTSAGFQFIKNKDWSGQIGNDGTSKNRWISANGSTSNITPGAGNYDLYLEENGKAYYIAEAGSPAPVAWSVVGIPDFDTDIMMSPVGNYLVARNVTVSKANTTFKFRTYGRWDTTNKGNPVGFVEKQVAVLYDGGDNCKINEGTYDIYLKGDDASVFFIVPPGHSLSNNDIVYKLDGKAIIGTINGGDWSTDQNIYVCGDYLGLKNVKIGAFKIRRNESWNDADVWGKNTESTSGTTVSGTLKQPGSNIGEGLSGNYDVLIDWNFTKYILKKQ